MHSALHGSFPSACSDFYLPVALILNILVPHVAHVPCVAGLPFFMVTGAGSFISRYCLRFMQQACIFRSPQPALPSASGVVRVNSVGALRYLPVSSSRRLRLNSFPSPLPLRHRPMVAPLWRSFRDVRPAIPSAVCLNTF